MSWIVETLDATVDDEIAALPPDMRARLAHIVQLIAEFGLERTGHPHVKHLEGPLWKMRVSGRNGIARAIYVTAKVRQSSSFAFSSRRPGRPRAASWRPPAAGLPGSNRRGR